MNVHKKNKHFTHLNQVKREDILTYKALGRSHSKIAKKLKCHYSTIGRELARNSVDKGYGNLHYSPLVAQEKYENRRKKANLHHIKLFKMDNLRTKIYQLLSNPSWIGGPSAICGRLKEEGRTTISTSTLYNYIHLHSKRRRFLRFHQGGYKNKPRKRKKTERIKGVQKIDKRPQIVEERIRIGDWEIDTIISKNHKGGLLTLIDRTSRYYLLAKIPDLKATTILTVATHLLQKFKVHTITADNGSEFALLAKLCKRLHAKGYTCHAYCSREKGSNEKHNGFVRRFIPKGADISLRSDAEIQAIQDKLNHMPRKCLNFKTPYEVQFGVNLKYT